MKGETVWLIPKINNLSFTSCGSHDEIGLVNVIEYVYDYPFQ